VKAKLSDLASLAEVIGAVAVVISLLYVGVQVRDTTRAVRSAAVNDANTAIQSWYQMMASDPQVLKTFLDGTLSPEPLSRDEEFRFMMTTQAAMYAFQNSYLLGREGSLDVGLMSSLNSGIQAVRHTPGFGRYWAERRGYFFPEFVAYVEELIAAPATPLDSMNVYRLPAEAPQ